MVEVLNSVNRSNSGTCTVRIVPPREEEESRTQYHPFILVYKIAENASKGGTALMKSNSEKRREAVCDFPLGPLTAALMTAEEAEVLSDIEEELLGLQAVEDPWTEDVTNNNSSLLAPPTPPLPPTASANFISLGMTDGTSKGTDLGSNGDFLQVQYLPLSADLLVLQCFRLPEVFDCPDFRIDSILPSPSGSFLLLVVNKEEMVGCREDQIVAGLIVYRLTFSGLMTGLVELPVAEKTLSGDGNRIKRAAFLPSDVDLQTGQEKVESLALITENGVLSILDFDAEEPLFLDKSGCRYTDVTAVSGEYCNLEVSAERDPLI